MCALFWALGCSSEAPREPQPQASERPRPPPTAKARLGQTSGTVMVKRAAGDDWLAAREGYPLYENDKVRTAPGASARLDFENGSLVNVGEDALVIIAESRPKPGLERTDLTVHKGQVDAELDSPGRQSFSVGTPAATVRAGREIVFQ